jgi:hypothetical protein
MSARLSSRTRRRAGGETDAARQTSIVKDAVFHNGAIEVELAGRPAAGAAGDARGFIGIAFCLQNGQFEYIYLRPTNGRADDQVRRNHSTQYSANPNFSFAVSRRQAPEKYESYVDLEPGVWTRFRITVEGTKARLYVHDASPARLSMISNSVIPLAASQSGSDRTPKAISAVSRSRRQGRCQAALLA